MSDDSEPDTGFLGPSAKLRDQPKGHPDPIGSCDRDMPAVPARGPDHGTGGLTGQSLLYDLVNPLDPFKLALQVRFGGMSDDVARDESESLTHCSTPLKRFATPWASADIRA